MSAIEVHDLTKRFGAITAVDGVSFEVQPGVVTGFLGPNGAGKTTTLRMILGLARATSGTALVEGSPYADLNEPIRAVGAVLERSGFHPGPACAGSPSYRGTRGAPTRVTRRRGARGGGADRRGRPARR